VRIDLAEVREAGNESEEINDVSSGGMNRDDFVAREVAPVLKEMRSTPANA